jgi:hypothetical protein
MPQPGATLFRLIVAAKRAVSTAHALEEKGKASAARLRYRFALDAWKEVTKMQPIFQGDLDAAIAEYQAFNTRDKQWQTCLQKIRSALMQQRQLLRSELHAQCPSLTPVEINKMLYHLERDGLIFCSKQKRDYLISLPPESDGTMLR